MHTHPTLRQALVAVKDSHEGPWQRSRGHETGIRIVGLGMGEVVVFESDADKPISFTQDGTFPFPKKVNHFRFIKQASLLDSKETYVQVVLK